MDSNVVNNFVKVSQEHTHVVVKGAGGLQGLPGPAGAGLKIDGSVDTYSELPHHLVPEDAGVAYFVQEDGLLYVWSGTKWPEEGEGAQFQGPRGVQGVQGEQGDPGEPGPANTLSIGEVHTGSTAAATITGDSPNQVLNLTLPKGNPGQDSYIPDLATFKSVALDVIYPVGSIYMSVNSTSPQTFLGGTWARIQDEFLLAAGTTYSAGSTGGEATHTLTVDEMPSHSHTSRTTVGWGSGGGSAVGKVTTNNGDYNGWPTTINNTGGDQAHNNMPPYLTVYVWKRTA
jgi:hypothetical protein